MYHWQSLTDMSNLFRECSACNFWSGWGLEAFLRWWPPSTMWVYPLIFLWPPPGYLKNPIFSNLGLCAACWTHFMCHHELWPTSAGHPFSFLNSSWGLTGGKHYQKITILIVSFVLKNFAIPGYFSYIIFYCYLFSLLSSGWFVIGEYQLFKISWLMSSMNKHFKCLCMPHCWKMIKMQMFICLLKYIHPVKVHIIHYIVLHGCVMCLSYKVSATIIYRCPKCSLHKSQPWNLSSCDVPLLTDSSFLVMQTYCQIRYNFQSHNPWK